jgi:hypothetical protein
MNGAATILTALSLVAYLAVVVMLWRFSMQPSVGSTVRATLRLFAAALLFGLVFLWSSELAAGSYDVSAIAAAIAAAIRDQAAVSVSI